MNMRAMAEIVMDSHSVVNATNEPELQNDIITVEGGNEASTDQSSAESQQPDVDKNALLAVLQFLKKYNLQETEGILRKETKLLDDHLPTSSQSSSDVTSVLSSFKSEGDPDIYEDAYTVLKKLVESSLDTYKYELSMILYPVFVRMYLELVYNDHEIQAVDFMAKFGPEQEEYYQDDLHKLASVTKKDHMKGNELMDNFKSEQFTLRMSRDTYNYLKRQLQNRKNSLLHNIIQEHLYFDVYEGMARNKQQVDTTAGAVLGEATRQANNTKVYYGLLKEPELPLPVDDEEESGEGEDKPKKKKPKKDPLLSKKARNDPNAPSNNRIPLPELRDADKLDKSNALREAKKGLKLGTETLPSICFYTLLNSHLGVACVEISEDSSLLAAGFVDAAVRVWSITPNSLKTMKPASELEQTDKEADDVLYRMMDEANATNMRLLLGHNGPVYSTSFSPDRNLLLSCSEDGTIRLWSLLTWTNVVCYKGHCFPVWDVKFSPHGYYFASCGHDRTARLWATDSHQPLRVFAGHVCDVDCVQFHPNSNYIATGSSDRTVRLWDVSNGNCVRYMTGHKGRIYTLVFSNCGRFLTSAGGDRKILVWDIATGHLVAELNSHTEALYSLCFSRDGTILASGGLDFCVKLWDFTKLSEELDLEDLNISHTPNVKTNTESYLLGSYRTKSTSVLSLHFTRRNLLLGTGMYQG